MAPWFSTAMANGLQRLLVLSLPGTPPSDTIKLTLSVWCDTIWPLTNWNDDDLPRIEAAFKLMCRSCERWPTPKTFIDCLPKREEKLKLDAPRLTPEQREVAKREVSAILAKLTQKVAP